MNKIFAVCLILVAVSVASQTLRNGQFDEQTKTKVWDQASQSWVTPEAFWLAYAQTRGGLTWGRGATYPPYDQVKELDTFMVELDSGICLMEFFHERWRRANDVRRWDVHFSEYSACPYVFD